MGEETPERPTEPVEEEVAPEVAPTPEAPSPSEWETRFKYLLADFENYRKRSAKEQEGLRASIRDRMILELVPLFEATLAALDSVATLPASDPVRRGIELLVKEWSKFWDAQGVTPVARRGMAFRSDVHEAVGEGEASRETPPGTILEVVQQGYRGRHGVLRPAKVVVARAPKTDSESAAADLEDASPALRNPSL
jgi:molecular chaperone GrpE